ncbi:uncharacterized protein LOC144303155 isoform X2 [Canis aureus]
MTEAEDGVAPRPRPSPLLASASARPPAALLGLRSDVVAVGGGARRRKNFNSLYQVLVEDPDPLCRKKGRKMIIPDPLLDIILLIFPAYLLTQARDLSGIAP